MMRQDLTDKRYLRAALEKAAIRPKRTAGQNFLICREVIEATLATLEGCPKAATELGSGPGALTQALVLSGWKVRAIESDRKMIEVLKKALPGKRWVDLEIVEGDIKKEKWWWDEPYVLVGNIPYNLSGLIIRKVTQLEPKPEAVVLMVQKEVGQKLAARAPELNLISVAAQLWGEVELILNVPRDCFWPKPKVDSQLILMRPYNKENELPLEMREMTMAVARKFFGFKRKQMGGVARRLWMVSAAEAGRILGGVGIESAHRPQEVEIKKWVELAKKIKS